MIRRFTLSTLAVVLLSTAAFGRGGNWSKSITTKYWTEGKDNNNLPATLTVSCDEVPGTAYKFCNVEVQINCLTALVSSPHEKQANDVFAQVQFDDNPLKLVVGKTDAEHFSPMVKFVGDDRILFLAAMNKAKKLRIILSFTTHDLIPEHGVRSGIFEFNVSNLPAVDEFLHLYYSNSAFKAASDGTR